MISYIKGEIAWVEADKVIVDVNGVGYGIYMSGQALSQLPSTGTEVRIYTYLHVKEDLMQLFGFLTRDDLQVFKLVIGVNGIGPKGGLNILAQLPPDELRFAVMANDVKAISKAPGIGKKTAEKLILELRDKLSVEDILERQQEEGAQEYAASGTGGLNNVSSEAVEALTALGYGSTEALKAVRQVTLTDGMQVEEVLKQALKYIVM